MDQILMQAIELARAQAGVRVMTEEQIAEFIVKTARQLKNIFESVEQPAETELVPFEDPKKAIRDRSVTCLVCGKKCRVLTKRHLQLHNMTTEEYREQFGYKKGTPLVCKELLRERKAKMDEMRLWEKRKVEKYS